jgi:hypothetical protein
MRFTNQLERASGRPAYPCGLLIGRILGHLLPYFVGVPERPYRQLVEDADFGEDIEVGKLAWFFVGAKRVSLGSFGNVLPTGVFIEYFQTSSC